MSNPIFKRAGGRRRHNKERQKAAQKRRKRIIEFLLEDQEYETFDPGWQTRLAEALGVHLGTISRDVRRIANDYQTTGFKGLGPRSNEKQVLLDRLCSILEDRRRRRFFMKQVAEAKKASDKRATTIHDDRKNQPELGSSINKKERAKEKKNIMKPAFRPPSRITTPYPFSIPRPDSRFKKMRCFPV